MNITKRDQMLLLVMVIILAAFVFFRFAYMPAQEEIQSLSVTQQELQQQNKNMEIIAQKVPLTSKNTEQKYADLNKRLPVEDELIPLLTVLDDSCQKCNVPLVSLEYRQIEEKNNSGPQTLAFTVITQGKVTQLLDLLNELEANQRLIIVQDVALTAVKAEQQSAAEAESSPPTYYIAPPGIPQAKLQWVTFEVEDSEEAVGEAEMPVAASLVPNQFEMKITINTYYTAKSASNRAPKEGEEVKDNTVKDAKGEE